MPLRLVRRSVLRVGDSKCVNKPKGEDDDETDWKIDLTLPADGSAIRATLHAQDDRYWLTGVMPE